MSYNAEPTDFLKPQREHIISKLRPLILKALGVETEQVAETPIMKTFFMENKTTLECSARRIGSLLICGLAQRSGPVSVEPYIGLAHSKLYEFIGDSQISQEVRYRLFDDEGTELDAQSLEGLFGNTGMQLHYYADELDIFDDFQFLLQKLEGLDPEQGIAVSSPDW